MAEIPKPFELTTSHFRAGTDYPKTENWNALDPKIAESLVEKAKGWMTAYRTSDQGAAIDVDYMEPFYKAVLNAANIRVNPEVIKTDIQAHTHAFATLRGLADALKSERFIISDKSPLHAVASQLRVSEAQTVLDIHNAALQQAQAQIDLSKERQL